MLTPKLRALAGGVMLAAALTGGVPSAFALDQGPAEPDGGGKAMAYAGCALGLALAPTIGTASAALLRCASLIYDEWKHMFG